MGAQCGCWCTCAATGHLKKYCSKGQPANPEATTVGAVQVGAALACKRLRRFTCKAGTTMDTVLQVARTATAAALPVLPILLLLLLLARRASLQRQRQAITCRCPDSAPRSRYHSRTAALVHPSMLLLLLLPGPQD
jgi:hypothetical protein